MRLLMEVWEDHMDCVVEAQLCLSMKQDVGGSFNKDFERFFLKFRFIFRVTNNVK